MPTPPLSALLVFAKRPEPGRVKTRLTALLTPEEAADLYAAMLRDALGAYAALGCAVRLYLAPDEQGNAPALPDGWVPGGVTVHAQHGDGLGQRMLH
ncbi:MAG: glycosyltransferase, partial [Bacteroidota bacterium]